MKSMKRGIKGGMKGGMKRGIEVKMLRGMQMSENA